MVTGDEGGRVRARRPLRLGVLLLLPVLLVWVVKVIRLHRSVEGYRAYWAQPRGEPGGLLYVALGDSAAQAIGASSPERGYVGLIAHRLRHATGRPVQVVNLSASGARIGDVLTTQLPRLRELSADVVTVAVGGNDLRGFDAATFAEQVRRLTAALPEGSFVADVPYFMHGRYERDALAAADLVTAGARAQGLVPVGLHEAQRAEGLSAMATQFAADWFHPNDRGHRVWADAFWSEMSSIRGTATSG